MQVFLYLFVHINIISVLISLSVNSVICVAHGFNYVNLFLSSLRVVFSCFIAYLVIFAWMPDSVNFTLSGA